MEGQEWLDFVMGNAAVVLGHGHPNIIEAVNQAMRLGLGAGVESELSIQAAEAFLSCVPTAEQVRFTNTGTEAAIHALHLARVVTGRQGLAKMEGAYHGWWDDVNVSTWSDLTKAGPAERPVALPGGPGLRPSPDITILPFNNLEAAREILTAKKEEIAALFIEPVLIDIGFIEPEPGYLEGLRKLTSELGILLVFDELLTGFRLGPGGAQGKYGVTPDLSLWSKGLANGFPVAALAGRREIMERSAPGAGNAPFVGTFNGFRPALAACLTALELQKDGTVAANLHRRTEELKREFNALAQAAGIAAQLHGGGGHVQPYFTDVTVRDYRSAATTDVKQYRAWADHLGANHLIVASGPLLHSAFSAAHGDQDFERFLELTRQAFALQGELHA
ncbi:aspartate aminotransferase family protein [Deinococcus metallilatus]|uniref:aspartate aminotransferase family protein n=1 Tax=Deinococcus metallilatus TaxID=1211322 RepID=UPI001FD45E89|nr:aminotransferase class III-fold pyridoxal phosphate-dependent enzyme [Deinococcus metallilatus]